MESKTFIVAWLEGYGQAHSEIVPMSVIKGWDLEDTIIEELMECAIGNRIDYYPFPLEHIVFIAI
jgi:hypothetical protein